MNEHSIKQLKRTKSWVHAWMEC